MSQKGGQQKRLAFIVGWMLMRFIIFVDMKGKVLKVPRVHKTSIRPNSLYIM